MGLDVYLYHCNDRAAAKALEERYERETEGFWKLHCDPNGDWKNLSKEEQDRRYETYKDECAKVAAALGLKKDGEHPGVSKFEEPSAKHADHYFKVGYFRSSYNDGGINNVLRRYGLPDLYYIMGAGDDYEFTPDWTASRARAEEVLNKLRALPHADLDIMTVAANPFSSPGSLPQSVEDARVRLLETVGRQRGDSSFGGSFSNGHGDFFLEDGGLEVVALIPGFEESFTKALFGQAQSCIYVAYRKKDGNEWYEKALEIVIETCDFVLSKPDPENYYLHWSG